MRFGGFSKIDKRSGRLLGTEEYFQYFEIIMFLFYSSTAVIRKSMEIVFSPSIKMEYISSVPREG